MDKNILETIQKVVEEMLQKMTIDFTSVLVVPKEGLEQEAGLSEAVEVEIAMQGAQLLIGQNGETLLEFQRIARMIVNKKLQKNIYLNIDIDGYKKKKIEYIKRLALEAAEEVIATKQKKVLAPMSAYERRIVHAKLAENKSVTSLSQGDGEKRCVVVSPV